MSSPRKCQRVSPALPTWSMCAAPSLMLQPACTIQHYGRLMECCNLRSATRTTAFATTLPFSGVMHIRARS